MQFLEDLWVKEYGSRGAIVSSTSNGEERKTTSNGEERKTHSRNVDDTTRDRTFDPTKILERAPAKYEYVPVADREPVSIEDGMVLFFIGNDKLRQLLSGDSERMIVGNTEKDRLKREKYRRLRKQYIMLMDGYSTRPKKEYTIEDRVAFAERVRASMSNSFGHMDVLLNFLRLHRGEDLPEQLRRDIHPPTPPRLEDMMRHDQELDVCRTDLERCTSDLDLSGDASVQLTKKLAKCNLMKRECINRLIENHIPVPSWEKSSTLYR